MKTNLMKSALMFMALGAAVFTSCSKGGDSPDNSPTPVHFTSAIAAPAPMTKAANAAWAEGDNVGIFMVGAGTTTISENAENRLYTTANASTFTTTAPIYYPLSGNVDFIAYYPYRERQLLVDTYPVNVATQTSQADIDLLWSNDAKTKNKLTASVPLTFKHQLCKVIINTSAGEGLSDTDLAAMKVTIKSMNTAANFNLTTGVLGSYSTITDIEAFTANAGKKYEAIVLPESLAAGALKMEFALNNSPKNEVFTRTNTITETFEAGRVYTYTMTVKRTGVTFSYAITDWDTSPTTIVGDAE